MTTPFHLKPGGPAKAALAALALCAGLAMTCGKQAPSDARPTPLLELPAWRGLTAEYGDRFELRREEAGGGRLLLRHSRREVVYRFDPAAGRLEAVTDADWRRAAGAVAECGRQFVRAEGVRVDQSRRLLAGGRELSAAGRTVLDLAESPSGRWLAVLSAAGEAGGSVIPFSSGGGAAGQYFHQLLELPGATWGKGTVLLPTRREYETLRPCWSADEQFVVYYQVDFDFLSVVWTKLPLLPSDSQKVSQ